MDQLFQGAGLDWLVGTSVVRKRNRINAVVIEVDRHSIDERTIGYRSSCRDTVAINKDQRVYASGPKTGCVQRQRNDVAFSGIIDNRSRGDLKGRIIFGER